MNDLVIRNLDEGVVESLQRSAILHGRSLEEELRDIVTQAARNVPLDRRALADALCARARYPQQTDSVELLREDRDR
jgi:plasmid stability protein